MLQVYIVAYVDLDSLKYGALGKTLANTCSAFEIN